MSPENTGILERAARGMAGVALLTSEAFTLPIATVAATGSEAVSVVISSPIAQVAEKLLDLYLISPVDEGAISVGTATGSIDEALPNIRRVKRQNNYNPYSNLYPNRFFDQNLNRRPPVLPNRR